MLEYIWISNFKNIKKKGFNLTSSKQYDFIEKEQDHKPLGIVGELKIKNIRSLNIFHKHISDIKAIIGANGAGKSTLLRSILELLLPFNNNFSGFVIINNTVFKSANIEITTDNGMNIQDFSKNSVIELLKDYRLIHYSPILNLDDVGFDYNLKGLTDVYTSSNFSDISLSEMIVRDFTLEVGENDSLNFNSELLAHKAAESRRNLHFIADDKNPSPFKNKVKTVQFKINKASQDFWENLFRLELIPDKLKNDRELKFTTMLNSHGSELSKWVTINLICTLLKKEYEYILIKTPTTKETALNRIMQLFENHYNNDVYKFQDLLISKVNFINEIEKQALKGYVKSLIKYLPTDHSLEGKFEIKIEAKDQIKKIIKLKYFNFKAGSSIINFFRYEFIGLSSGEKAILSFYSRLNELIDNIPTRCKVILLLDEPEIMLHPMWQKEFIYSLNKNLPKIFSNKDIQIIITSHSPILISDLPTNNVLFLNEDEHGNCEIENGTIEKTFGANIHDLYANAFFLNSEGGAMGKFAANTINKIGDLIKKKKELNNNQEKLIDEIGEPLIRHRLKEMLLINKEIQNIDKLSYEAKIKFYEEELLKLKRK